MDGRRALAGVSGPQGNAPSRPAGLAPASLTGRPRRRQPAGPSDIRDETTDDGIAKITICRPEVHNAFRPQTLIEMSAALTVAREDESVGGIILTGQGD